MSLAMFGAFQIPEWAIDASPALQHILAKLHRVDEHIDLLETEVNAYLEKNTGRELPNYDPTSEATFTIANENVVGDPRLGIITGEVLYQLRSTLDHIVCALVTASGNTPTKVSQFPIFSVEPTTKDDINRYNKHLAGINDADALAVIKGFQPYQQDAHQYVRYSADMFAVLQALSNFDKHRALLLHVVKVNRRVRMSLTDSQGLTAHIETSDNEAGMRGLEDLAAMIPESDKQRSLITYVAFEQFGASSDMPVVDGLRHLRDAFAPFLAEMWGCFASKRKGVP